MPYEQWSQAPRGRAAIAANRAAEIVWDVALPRLSAATDLFSLARSFTVWNPKPMGGSGAGWKLIRGPYGYPHPYAGKPRVVVNGHWTQGPITGQAVPYPDNLTFPPTGNVAGVWIMSSTNSYFHAQNSAWQYVGGEPATGMTLTFDKAGVAARVVNEKHPFVSEGVRIGIPVAPPYWAIPLLPAIDPFRAPSQQPLRGHDSAPAMRVAPRVVQRISAYPNGNIQRQSVPEKRQPPDKNTREKKMIGNIKPGSFLANALNTITEGTDVINAAWEAVPESQRPGMKWSKKKGEYVRVWNPPPQYKVKWLYNNLDKIDGNEFVQNFAMNIVEDQLIGRLSRATTKASQPWLRRMKRPFGLTTGPAL